MQPMLSGVAVRGRIWHAAHALARDKSVLSSLWRKNQVDYYGEPRNSGHLFFQTPKRAHVLKSGRKNDTHVCVVPLLSPMGGLGMIEWYIRLYIPPVSHDQYHIDIFHYWSSLRQSNMANWKMPDQTSVNDGFSSKLCLITRWYIYYCMPYIL